LREFRPAITQGAAVQAIDLGPLYNEIVRNPEVECDPIRIYQSRIICPYPFPQDQLTNDGYPLDRFLVNPCSIDTIFQTAAIHIVNNHERVYLPYGIGELNMVRPICADGLYKAYGQLVTDRGDIVYYDMTVADQNHNVYYHAKRIAFKMIQK
jgi:hypothetical protein